MIKSYTGANFNYSEFALSLRTYDNKDKVSNPVKQTAILHTDREVIGLSQRTLKLIAKEIVKNNPEQFLNTAQPVTYEEMMIYGLVVAGLKDEQLRAANLSKFIKMADSWSLCDNVILSMKFLKDEKTKSANFDYYASLCRSEQEYEARFGIVTLLTYYLEDKFAHRVLEICTEVTNDKYYVQMAVAWLLSVAYVKYKESVLKILRSGALPRFTHNQAISKCLDSYKVSAEDKTYLKTLRR